MTAQPENLDDLLREYWDELALGNGPSIDEYLLRLSPGVHDAFREAAEVWKAIHDLGPPEDDPVQSVSLEGFELLKQLGCGGSAVVYKARNIDGERVALKLLHAGLVEMNDNMERFKREAEALAEIEPHPSIARFYSAGEDNGHHYIEMELVGYHGDTARTYLRAHTPGTPRGKKATYLMVEWAGDVAGALQHAHDAGVIHRDVKPENILLTDDGRPKLTDFGLAKLVGDGPASKTNSGVGSPYYMAPEQVDGSIGPVGPWTDVWGLGATLYELLTLYKPFPGNSRPSIERLILDAYPADPRLYVAEIPAPLVAIVGKCLERSPSRRYQTARALREDLQRFMGGWSVQARPPGPLRKVHGWCRRHPAVSLFLATACVASFALGSMRSKQLQAEQRTDVSIEVHQRLAKLRSATAPPKNSREQLSELSSLIERSFVSHPVQRGAVLLECADLALGFGLIEERAELLQAAHQADPGSRKITSLLSETLVSLERASEALPLLDGGKFKVLELEAILSIRDGALLDAWERKHGAAVPFLQGEVARLTEELGGMSLEVGRTELTLGALLLTRGDLQGASDHIEASFFQQPREMGRFSRMDIHRSQAALSLGHLASQTERPSLASARLEAVRESRLIRWGPNDLRTLRAEVDLGWTEVALGLKGGRERLRSVMMRTTNPALLDQAETGLQIPEYKLKLGSPLQDERRRLIREMLAGR